MFPFYTLWKHQITFGFLMFSGRCKIGTLARNGLIKAFHFGTLVEEIVSSIISFLLAVLSFVYELSVYLFCKLLKSQIFVKSY